MLNDKRTDFLLVEYDPRATGLAFRALVISNLEKAKVQKTDGARALDFMSRRGAFADREVGPERELAYYRLLISGLPSERARGSA